MAESGDSVGKISLDLEVTSDLSNQINKVSNVIGKKLKDTMDNATKGMFNNMSESMDKNMQSMSNSLKSGLNKMKQNIRSTFTSTLDALKNVKMPKINFPKIDIGKPNTSDATSQATTRGPPKINTEALKAEIENTASALDIVNAKIEQQQTKLTQLKEAYANTFNTARKNKIEEQILKTEAAINGLINKSDKLGFKLADLDAKLAGAGKGVGQAASKFNLLNKVTGSFGSLANGTANMSKKLSESLKSLGSSCKSTNNHMSKMHNGLGNIARQFATWMIILPLIMKGLEAMTSGLIADLKTNEQFNNSLAQIKTNLMVAFTPIFYAILPAINSLMSALATATTYIASFISAIFGKTYQQSFQATQGLIDAKKAMGAYGDSAKKAAKDAMGLAAFDEINNLSKNKGAEDNSKVPTLTQPSMDTSQVDSKMQALADKIKKVFGEIFAPMKQAWDKEGKATMDALKGALSSIWDLAKDIGKTFLDVWGNGTGVRVCTSILKLLQTVFNIIGDIAKAFKTAWDNGELGKALVQAIFNALDSVLKLLNTIGQVFRDVWNSGIGVEICTNILEILKNIFTIIGQVADSFNKAFQSDVGKQLVTDLLNLLDGCLRIIQDITASFSKAWETNGDTIASAILLILDDIVGTISDIANKWANAWESNGNGDKLMDSLLSTLGKILTAIGDIGKGMRESIGNVADEIFPSMIQFATDVSTGLGNVADGFKIIWDNGGKHLFDGIVQLIAKIAELIMKITGQSFSDFSNLFKEVLAPAIGKVCDFVGDLCDKLAKLVDWISQCQPLVDVLSGGLAGLLIAFEGFKALSAIWEILAPILTGIGDFIALACSDGIIAALGEVIGTIVAAIGGWPVLIAAAIIGIGIVIYNHWDEIKAKTSEIWNGIGDWIGAKWNDFSTWASEKFGSIKETITTKWEETKTSSETKWSDFATWVGTKWDGIKISASTKFGEIKDAILTKWEETKTNSSDKWNDFTTWLSNKWGESKTNASTKFGEIKDTVLTKWDEIKTNSSTKWDDFSTWISSKWGGLKDTASEKFGNIVDYLNNTFSTNWDNAWKGLANIVDNAFKSLEGMVKKPINAIIGMANYLIEKLNSIKFDIPDSKIFGDYAGESFGIHIPTIPKLATGGIIDSPTLAMVGEAGKEAVMPLENNTGWITELAGKIAGIMGASSGSVSASSGGDGDIIFMLDGEILGKVAIKQLQKMKRQGYDLSSLI